MVYAGRRGQFNFSKKARFVKFHKLLGTSICHGWVELKSIGPPMFFCTVRCLSGNGVCFVLGLAGVVHWSSLGVGSCCATSDHPGQTLLKPQHHQLVHQQIATAGSSGHIRFVLKEKLRFSLQRCCEFTRTPSQCVTLGALHFLSVSTCSRVCKCELCHVR